MKIEVIAYAAAMLLACTTTLAVADNDVASGLGTCKSIESDTERLACYDQLAGATTSGPVPVAVAVAATTTAPTESPQPSAPQPLTDDVAKEVVEDKVAERPEYAAMVTRCDDAKREHRKFFLMENGQVWKQANTGRMSFRDKSCNFEVTITKDAFGWVMEIPSENRKVRVKRVK